METTAAVRLLLDELDEGDRQLVKLKYFDELKYVEISNRLGLTVGNVGYRLHHILIVLAQKLRRLGIDETL
jgi:RNA polymerase sigma-70 factor (ECF subfamily)